MTTAADPAARNRPEGRMNGGRALAEMLRLSGAGPMFGMGGFQLLPFYEAMRALGLRHFLINDERCGAFAARRRQRREKDITVVWVHRRLPRTGIERAMLKRPPNRHR